MAVKKSKTQKAKSPTKKAPAKKSAKPSDNKSKAEQKQDAPVADPNKPVEKLPNGLLPVEFALQQLEEIDSGITPHTKKAEAPVLGQPQAKKTGTFIKVTDMPNGVDVELKGKKVVVTQSEDGNTFFIETLSLVSNAVTIANFKPVDLKVYDDKNPDGSISRRAYVKIEMSKETLDTIAKAYIRIGKRESQNKV